MSSPVSFPHSHCSQVVHEVLMKLHKGTKGLFHGAHMMLPLLVFEAANIINLQQNVFLRTRSGKISPLLRSRYLGSCSTAPH